MSNKTIYTVVCTDINEYVNWQFELLEYSWSRINQPGKLIRLVACEDDVALPEHRHAEVYRTRPTNVHPDSGDKYVCYNRLYSLQQWLDECDIDGTILVVDCDVVFTKPIKTTVQQGSPLGQNWLDYGVAGFDSAIQNTSDISIDSLQAVTWPMLIDANDLRALMPRWIEATVSIREQLKRQESDMFAMLVAAAEMRLTFQLEKITAFMSWTDEKVGNTSLIHYCQVVKGIHGENLWGKWNYQPWDRVQNADTADLMYCRVLLNLVDEFARLKSFESSHQNETIFIALASYCDAELVDTIQSCLQKARHPENLRFGICHQFDNSDILTSETCLDQFSQDRRFRYVVYDHRDSKGGCWARELAQQLYDGETYTLQIDSHTQMIESWDTILIEMLQSMPSEKPLITQFPPLYSRNAEGKNYFLVDDLSQVNIAVPVQWSPDGWLEHTQQLMPENNVFPRYTRMLSGAFLFTSGEWCDVVRQDPSYLYVGEEFALTLRSFTHGYDLFDPNQIVCWHRLHPQANRKYRHDNSVEKCKRMHDRAISRLQLLMQGDPDNELDRFGLGVQRSLQDYAQLTGIDCENKTLTDAALEGELMTINTSTAASLQDQLSMSIIDVTVHTGNMEPLLLSCDEQTPILLSLFVALINKSTKPDDLICLQLGENGQEAVYFKNKELVSIETSPTLSEDFLNRLSAQVELESSTVQLGNESVIINDDWKIWIWRSVGLGYSKDGIFKQLVEAGFSWQTAKTELNYEPSVPLQQIEINQPNTLTQEPYQANAMAQRIADDRLEIYTVDDFLNQQECDDLLAIMRENHVRSKVVDATGNVESTVRTNSSCFFEEDNEQHKLAQEVRSRLCKITGISIEYAESIQGQLYEKGEEYKAHYDWFEPGTKVFENEAAPGKSGQRVWSAIVYLNDVPSGGETYFEKLDLTLQPKSGRVVFWNNLDNNGAPNYDALHQACPVLEGQKAILTLWFRAVGEGEMYIGEKNDLLPAYTVSGFEKKTMSGQLFNALVDCYQNSSEADKRKEVNVDYFIKNKSGQLPSQLTDIPEELRKQIINEFLPVCEQWSQTELEFSALYGIRNYARGSSLKMHSDIQDTHIISVILNIAQQVDEDWPLEIDDHMGRRHSVLLSPGEALLYEGARLSHGRPTPLVGDDYANIFLHFRPKNLSR